MEMEEKECIMPECDISEEDNDKEVRKKSVRNKRVLRRSSSKTQFRFKTLSTYKNYNYDWF